MALRTQNLPVKRPEATSWLRFLPVTPDDDAKLEPGCSGLVHGSATAADITVVDTYGNDPITFKAVPPGVQLCVCVSKVMETDTDATEIIALY